MTVFQAVLSSDTSTLQIIKAYEEAVNAYSQQQDDAHFQKMMKHKRLWTKIVHGIIMQKLKPYYLN